MYFQLNPMLEEGIKFIALYLNGLAYEWQHHGMVTLRHGHISYYIDLIKMLIECFDKKDLELHFKELAQLEQWALIDT